MPKIQWNNLMWAVLLAVYIFIYTYDLTNTIILCDSGDKSYDIFYIYNNTPPIAENTSTSTPDITPVVNTPELTPVEPCTGSTLSMSLSDYDKLETDKKPFYIEENVQNN